MSNQAQVDLAKKWDAELSALVAEWLEDAYQACNEDLDAFNLLLAGISTVLTNATGQVVFSLPFKKAQSILLAQLLFSVADQEGTKVALRYVEDLRTLKNSLSH